jgi:hypothetical protein
MSQGLNIAILLKIVIPAWSQACPGKPALECHRGFEAGGKHVAANLC